MTIKTLPQWRNFAIGSREEVRLSQVSHDRVRDTIYQNLVTQILDFKLRTEKGDTNEREKKRERKSMRFYFHSLLI